MLDQLLKIVQESGQTAVVENPEVPNEYNQDLMADATHTIASGFQNVMAGGGFQNILDLFRGAGTGSGPGGLLKNPMVTMMVGYFINKLVNKYRLNPSSASNVANRLIPDAIQNLVKQTNDPGNTTATMDNLVGALVGKQAVVNSGQPETGGGFSLQNLLEQITGAGGNQGGSATGGFDIQDIIGNLTRKAQYHFQDQSAGGGGLMDLIKGFMK